MSTLDKLSITLAIVASAVCLELWHIKAIENLNRRVTDIEVGNCNIVFPDKAYMCPLTPEQRE